MSKLNQVKILVTRPAHQSEHLCQLIEAEGGLPVRLPAIEIVEIDDKSVLLDCRAHINQLDMAIFVSVNAVEKSLPILSQSLTAMTSPPLQLIAIGQRTAKALQAWGLTPLCPQPPFDSEALLKMPQTESLSGKNIVIFRGQGGRELLAETLRQRGATVNYINTYRRRQPVTPAWITEIQVDIVTATSVESLGNLFAMLDGHYWLYHTPLVVFSERVADKARRLGVQAPILTAPFASDEGLLIALLQAHQNGLDRKPCSKSFYFGQEG